MFLVYTHWSCDMYGRTEISRAAKPILKHFYKQGAFSQEAQLYEYETIFKNSSQLTENVLTTFTNTVKS